MVVTTWESLALNQGSANTKTPGFFFPKLARLFHDKRSLGGYLDNFLLLLNKTKDLIFLQLPHSPVTNSKT